MPRRIPPILVPKLLRFLLDIECSPRLIRTDHRIRPLIKRIHALQRVGFFQHAEMLVYNRPHFTPSRKMFLIHTLWKVQISDRKTAAGWVRAQAEWPISRTEKSGSGKRVRLAWDADIWRQIVPWTKLMRNYASKAGILHRRARSPAREHVMRASVMIGFTVCHRPNHTDFVGHFRRLFQELAEINPSELRSYVPERSSILDRRKYLWIE